MNITLWVDIKRGERLRCGFKGKNQAPLFMVWREHWGMNEDGLMEVVHADCLFTTDRLWNK